MLTAGAGFGFCAEAVGLVSLALGNEVVGEHRLHGNCRFSHLLCKLTDLPLSASTHSFVAEVDKLAEVHLNADLCAASVGKEHSCVFSRDAESEKLRIYSL